MPEHLETTIHDFKTNITRYIRQLERGEYRAVVVKRYRRTVGIFMTVNQAQPDAAEEPFP